MNYIPKYKRVGKHIRPSMWVLGTDTDIVTHDKHYAWLKHRAQAKYRSEDYSLTFEQWKQLWPNDKWFGRGRGKNDLCLMQIDREGGWHIHNVDVVERMVYLARAAEYQDYKK